LPFDDVFCYDGCSFIGYTNLIEETSREHRIKRLAMTIYDILNFLAFAALAAAGIVPTLMAFRVKISSLRILSSLLGVFALSHGLYHLAFIYDLEFLAVVIIQPVAVISLIGFGLYYSKKAMI